MTEPTRSPRRRRARHAALGLAAILVLSLSGWTPSARANQLDFLASGAELEQERTIDHLAVQTREGLTMLARWYIQGFITPIPDPAPAEFLYARAIHRGDVEGRDTALGMTGSWSSLHLNDYLKWGAADSTRLDVPTRADGTPRPVKTLTGQASLVRLFTMAWQVSGKEMFQRAAARTADDLVRWSFRGETLLDWTSNDPDTLMGPVASAAATGDAATHLVEAAMVFRQPRWAPDWLARLAPEPTVPALLPSGEPASPADTIAATRAALSLVRAGNWTHADSLVERASECLAPLQLAQTHPTRDMPLFAARATAGLTLELIANPSVMAYIVGDPAAPATQALRDAALGAWRPGRMVQVRPADYPGLLYPSSGDGKPLAYVCSGELCAPPTSDAAEVALLVRTFALPDPPAPIPSPGQ